ncbi:MAG: Maf family protein [Puniceicoccaceae bacterium]
MIPRMDEVDRDNSQTITGTGVKESQTAPRPVLLASASPRRAELLAAAGIPFRVEPARVVEHADPGADPEDLVRRNAALKAREVAGRFPGEAVLGADTAVSLDGVVFGKPKDYDDAFAMLRALSGRSHEVRTGVCLVRRDGCDEVFCALSRVTFRRLSDADIRAYIRDVHVFDKAGAYAIQEEGGRIIAGREGSRTNVIGLPMEEVLPRLRSNDRRRLQPGGLFPHSAP